LSRRAPTLKTRLAPEIEGAVGSLAGAPPAGGPLRAANDRAKRGLKISAAGVRGVWGRHEVEHRAPRLTALEARGAQEGPILPEAPLLALETAKAERAAQGEFGSEGPGSWGAQATLYVGPRRGVGRSDPQPFIAPESQGAWAQ
jgi:hypothetical protein